MSALNQKVSADDVETLFSIMLGRPTRNDVWRENKVSSGISIADFLAQIRRSGELVTKVCGEANVSVAGPSIVDDHRFRIPEHLSVTPPAPLKILLVGSCLMNSWTRIVKTHHPSTNISRIVFNNASELPPMTPQELRSLDFQIVQIPLRAILKEAWFYPLKIGDKKGHDALFARTCDFLARNFAAAMRYNENGGLPSYVLGFCAPLQNPLGRPQDRYSLENVVYFVEMLNKQLYDLVQQRKNSHFIDMDEIVSTFGKKYFQDDSVLQINHGSSLTEMRTRDDYARLEPIGDVGAIYSSAVEKCVLTAFKEILGLRKSESQTDAVKLVIFDLDDTLWRGVAAEMDSPDAGIAEGWPLGILEAAVYLWKRGILIAVVSKNDEANVRAIWDKVYGGKFSLDHFVSLKINWDSKPRNIEEIIRSVNVLPGSVLFVDDNPVERAAVKQHFPEIRVLETSLLEWRRILLWAPELQRSHITAEAIQRTAMVQSQIERESARGSMSQDDFLQSLQIRIEWRILSDSADSRFARCFELINKSNQFNTTGRRWTQAELDEAFAAGAYLIALDVADSYTEYGLTAVAVIQDNVIAQFVMSCRVFGMGIEQAAIALAQTKIGAARVLGVIRTTEKNRLALQLFEKLGFALQPDGLWAIAETKLVVPSNLQVVAAREVGDPRVEVTRAARALV